MTKPFSPDGEPCDEKDDDVHDEEGKEPEESRNDEDILAQQFNTSTDLSDKDPDLLPGMMHNPSFGEIRDNDTNECGCHDNADVATLTTTSNLEGFVSTWNVRQGRVFRGHCETM